MSHKHHNAILVRRVVDLNTLIMRGIIFILILLYQKTLSPDHGIFFYFIRMFGGAHSFDRCRFSPSCSEYSKEAFGQYGLLRGSMSSLARIIRCGPWSVGGHDPVVKKL